MSSLSPKSPVVGYEHAIAGIGAGASATLATYPLDLLRTRFQVRDVQMRATTSPALPPSVWGTFASIIRNEGPRGLYQGFWPNFIGSAISWGQYFYLYQRFKETMRGRHREQELGPVQHLLAGLAAGSLTAICTNPIWVVKTRMQTQMNGAEGNYRGLIRARTAAAVAGGGAARVLQGLGAGSSRSVTRSSAVHGI